MRSGKALSSEIRDLARVNAGLRLASFAASWNSLERPGPARCWRVDLRKLKGRFCGDAAAGVESAASVASISLALSLSSTESP